MIRYYSSYNSCFLFEESFHGIDIFHGLKIAWNISGNIIYHDPFFSRIYTSKTLFSICCSNAIKFTHEGKVGINLYVVPDPSSSKGEASHQTLNAAEANGRKEEKLEKHRSTSQTNGDQEGTHGQTQNESAYRNHHLSDESRTPVKSQAFVDEAAEEHPHSFETTVWICCDVYDTGIGIPGNATFFSTQ